jgi:glycosyltransferase involved in cell wall biosynthesis
MAMTSARSNSDGPGRYNIFVFPRGVPNVRTTVHLLRAARKQIVLEVDDDFTNRYRQVVPDNFHKELWAFAREDVTAITCSTRYLADLMATETGKPTYVLPNSVPFSEWAYVPKRQRLTIALTGSDTHGGDWIVVKDVMPEILARYPEVDFLMAGMLPSYFQTLKDRFPNRFEFVPWVAFRNYSRLVGSAHIILCPVDPDDGFNLSKSGLKAIEGMAAGAAVVATDMLIYQDVMEHNRHGLLVPFKPEAWFDAISRLIEDREFRARLGSEAKRHARKKHALDVNADRWWQAYCQIAGV